LATPNERIKRSKSYSSPKAKSVLLGKLVSVDASTEAEDEYIPRYFYDTAIIEKRMLSFIGLTTDCIQAYLKRTSDPSADELKTILERAREYKDELLQEKTIFDKCMSSS
jgi:hypothetical protein